MATSTRPNTPYSGTGTKVKKSKIIVETKKTGRQETASYASSSSPHPLDKKISFSAKGAKNIKVEIDGKELNSSNKNLNDNVRIIKKKTY